jgi:hypothetical protein
MQQTITGSAFGAPFSVTVPEGLSEDCAVMLPQGWAAATGAPTPAAWRLTEEPSGAWQVWRGEDAQLAFDDPASALHALTGAVELHVAEHSPHLTLVHAGVVAGAGGALVLPGRSQAGKSTLVAALVAAGASYYSDEFAVLDARGRVRPYARPLSLRQQGAPARRVTAAELGGITGSAASQIRLIARLRYDSAIGWSVAEITPGRAALLMIDNCVAARSHPEGVLDRVHAAVRGVRALDGIRGDAADTAARLLALLEDAAPARSGVRPTSRGRSRRTNTDGVE